MTEIVALVFVGVMISGFCLWIGRMWWHRLRHTHQIASLSLGPLIYNSIVALMLLAQLICWIAYIVLQSHLTSPQLAYDIYDNRETSRARLLLPYKIDNASIAAVHDGGDEAFLGYYRWPLQTNSTGIAEYASMLHSMALLTSLQVLLLLCCPCANCSLLPSTYWPILLTPVLV